MAGAETPPSGLRRPGWRIGLGAAIVALWALGGLWVAPSLIRQAYNQESLDVFNRIISGRSTNPVETYLGAWRSVFLLATPVLLLVLAAFVFPRARRRLLTWLVGGEPGLRAPALIWYAVWIGLLGGAGEALYHGIRQVWVHTPAFGLARERFWMAPLSSALAGLLAGLVMVAVARAGVTRWHVGKATTFLGVGAIYAVLQSDGISLHPVAAVLLSLGLATVLARLAASRAGQLERLIRIGRPYLAVLILGAGAYGWYTLPSVAERRALQDRPEARSGAPNILLIILDTVRAANLSLYGYGRPTTPHLDDWASTGVVFDRAISTAPWTLPSHSSVFTGHYNYINHTGFYRPLDDAHPTLAEVLAAQGYATAGFTANLIYTNDWSGLERGFDRWEDFVPGLGMFFESSWLSQRVWRPLVGRHFFAKGADIMSRDFASWLATRPDRPFFAFINFFDAHAPITVPREFAATFGPLPPEKFDDVKAEWDVYPDSLRTPRRMELWVNKYDDALAFIDRSLETVRDTLEAHGLLDNTIVILTGDHGEMWGEHGVIGHSSALYEELIHVPLFISFPPGVPAAGRIDASVSLRDIPSTILQLAGLSEVDFPGTSLSSLWTDSESAAAPSLSLSETDYDANNAQPWTPLSRGDMKSLYWERYHYILNGDGVEELYDLSRDPSELHDLGRTPDHRATTVLIRAKLDSLLSLGDRPP